MPWQPPLFAIVALLSTTDRYVLPNSVSHKHFMMSSASNISNIVRPGQQYTAFAPTVNGRPDETKLLGPSPFAIAIKLVCLLQRQAVIMCMITAAAG
jgi:hypothetical protein